MRVNMVEYIKHGWKYSSGWQLTSDIDYTQAQLYDERNSTAAIYGFGPA